MPSDLWKSPTPLWQLILAWSFVTMLIGFTCFAWISFFRMHRSPFKLREKAFLVGLVILTLHLLLGGLLFFIQPWVVPQHDKIGHGWFILSPVVMLFVLMCGSIAWRASGKKLVVAGLAGLSLWVLVAYTALI